MVSKYDCYLWVCSATPVITFPFTPFTGTSLFLKPPCLLSCIIQRYSEFLQLIQLSCLLSSVFSLLCPVLGIFTVAVSSVVGILYHLDSFCCLFKYAKAVLQVQLKSFPCVGVLIFYCVKSPLPLLSSLLFVFLSFNDNVATISTWSLPTLAPRLALTS